MGLKDANRFARLHQQRLIFFQLFEAGNNLIEIFPSACRTADPAIQNQLMGFSATSGCRLFISIRIGASVNQLLAVKLVPVAGKTSRVFLRGSLMEGLLALGLDWPGLDWWGRSDLGDVPCAVARQAFHSAPYGMG